MIGSFVVDPQLIHLSTPVPLVFRAKVPKLLPACPEILPAESVSGLQDPQFTKTMAFIPRRPRAPRIRRSARLNSGLCGSNARICPSVFPFRPWTESIDYGNPRMQLQLALPPRFHNTLVPPTLQEEIEGSGDVQSVMERVRTAPEEHHTLPMTIQKQASSGDWYEYPDILCLAVVCAHAPSRASVSCWLSVAL